MMMDSHRRIDLAHHSRESMVAMATVMGFCTPVLWNLTVAYSPPMVWTVTGLALMLACVVIGKSYLMVDHRVVACVAVYLGLYAGGSLLSYLMVGEPSDEREALLWTNMGALLGGAIHFLFGVQLSANRNKWGAQAGMMLACLVVAIYAIAERYVLLSQDTITHLNRDHLFVEYHFLGDYLVMGALVLMGGIRPRRPLFRVLSLLAFLIVTTIILFIVPSRSAALLGLISMIVGLLMQLSWKPRLHVVVGIAVLLLLIKGMPRDLLVLAEGTRFESIFNDPSSDGSLLERLEILRQGWSSITENPILGNWAFQIEWLANPNSSIHSALDLWAQAGILPFFAFLLMWAVVCRFWWRTYMSDREWAIQILPGLVFALLSWCLTRQAGHGILLFCLGYATSVKHVPVSGRPRRSRRSLHPLHA